MPYITREDGEHFVIPSYRDVLVVKQKSVLKKEILTLSQSYGEYITLQKKGPNQYEVAFSNETGYLLGESVWHYLKKPMDLIYCEAVAGTTEAILVIVKMGSVYLDGRFPIDSIPEELVIFLTQQNHFEIYIFGDVPISEHPETGKFNFEASSVKSFNVLEKPIFSALPLIRSYQLQLVDQVLKSYGIGVFPYRKLVMTLIILVGGFFVYQFLFVGKSKVIISSKPQINPFQEYINELMTPEPSEVINTFVKEINLLATMPGWMPTTLNLNKNVLTANVISKGVKIEQLQKWVQENDYIIAIQTNGILISKTFALENRKMPTEIYKIDDVIVRIIDNISSVYPGNHAVLGVIRKKGVFTIIPVTVNIDSGTPFLFQLIGSQFKDLPFDVKGIDVTYSQGTLRGKIILDALGS